MRARLMFSCIATLVLAACTSDRQNPSRPMSISPIAPSGQSAVVAPLIPDLSGSWNVSGTGYLTLPPFVAPIFGIEPEGPITHLRCEGSGTMQLVQSGSTFNGSFTRTAVTCETGGGLVFVPPPTAFPPTLEVADGVITGRGLHFLLGSVAGLGCPHNGAITNVDAGTAMEIRANGRCIIPGHPQSPAPLDPPPAGTSHDTGFVATRP